MLFKGKSVAVVQCPAACPPWDSQVARRACIGYLFWGKYFLKNKKGKKIWARWHVDLCEMP